MGALGQDVNKAGALTEREIFKARPLVSSMRPMQVPPRARVKPDFPSKWPVAAVLLVFLGLLAFGAIYSSAETLRVDLQEHGEIR